MNIIIGGTIEGLFASYVLAEHGQESVILEPGEFCKDFLRKGMKYIFRSNELVEILYDLDIAYSEYMMKGGILLSGEIKNYPQILDTLDLHRIRKIQIDHFRKTRKAFSRSVGRTLMNDYGMKKTTRCALKLNFENLVKTMIENSDIIKNNAIKINSKESIVELDDGNTIEYERLISTIPLWKMKRISDFYIPESIAMSLNLIYIASFQKTEFDKWDFVYTTYTPKMAIHRISSSTNCCVIEANGNWDDIKNDVLEDLAFLFPDGFYFQEVVENTKGHIIELKEKIKWPNNIFPLGRFTQWNPSVTTNSSLIQMYKYCKEWGLST
jgi:hypothetical protein